MNFLKQHIRKLRAYEAAKAELLPNPHPFICQRIFLNEKGEN